jgi:hypothetical protein
MEVVRLALIMGDCGIIEELGNIRYLTLWDMADATLTESTRIRRRLAQRSIPARHVRGLRSSARI